MTKRKRKKRRSTHRARRSVWALAVVVLGALSLLAYLLIVYPTRVHEGPTRSFSFEMEEDLASLCERLEEEGVVDSAWVYGAYHRLVAGDEALRTGSVLLARDLRAGEVLRRLVRGRGPVPRRFVVPEGFTRFAIAERLEEASICGAAEFLAATAAPPAGVNAPSREGYLFPDTYEFHEGTPAREVAERMEGNFRHRLDAIAERHRSAVQRLETEGVSLHEVVVLASVVEREAAVGAERARIAGVFWNRLRSDTFLPRHRLQADPTVSYGCLAEPHRAPSCAGYDGPITRAMLNDRANRYNTYRHGGLPPGPIANPGAGAIEAVLAPESHELLYFVARGHGRHAFAADLETHNANVTRYRR